MERNINIVSRVPDLLGWRGNVFKRSELEDYIIVQERTTRTGNKVGVEYFTIEGKLKIFVDVCEKKGWTYNILFNIERLEFLPDEPGMARLLVSCQIEVRDNDKVLFNVKAYNLSKVDITTHDPKKAQTNALGRALSLLGIGLEAQPLEELEDDGADETESKMQKVVQKPQQTDKDYNHQVKKDAIELHKQKMYEQTLVLAKQFPDVYAFVKEELEMLGKKKFSELNYEQAKKLYMEAKHLVEHLESPEEPSFDVEETIDERSDE